MLQVGQEAPDFTLPSHLGDSVTLSQYRGEKNVVLLFYPWAFTGICTGELCAIRDELEAFENEDTVTLGISCDVKFSLRVFANQEGYTFPLLSDFWPHGAVAQAYGVFVEQAGAAKRGTFVIDKQGVVRWTVIHEIGQGRDAEDYKKALADLG